MFHVFLTPTLTVKDIKRSRKLYVGLGFREFDDHEEDNLLIMRSGKHTSVQ